MTQTELYRLRQTQHWRNAHALTQTGNYVAGVQRLLNPSYGNQRIISGRVLVNGEAGGAVYANWWLNGMAINHNWGNLDMETVSR